MKENGGGEHDAGDPVVGHPIELDAHLGQERGDQQREHRDRHDPVKGAATSECLGTRSGTAATTAGRIVFRKLLWRGEDAHVDCVDDHEEQSRDDRRPISGTTQYGSEPTCPHGLVAQVMKPMLPPARRRWRASPGFSSAESCRR